MNCAGHFRAVIFRMGFWLAAVALGLLLIPGLVAPVCAGTFGRVVPIVGEASDIALDEPRGVLYIANFTANRIDVMSLKDYSIRKSLHVAPNPGSLALSPDGNYLVITHFGNYTAPTSSSNAL
jgi:DNA-binding beta-propeller fold protein YncE